MRRIFAILLCAVMIFSAMSMSVFAQSGKDDSELGAGDIFGTTYVYFENAAVKVGKTVTVDLMIKSNPGITDISVTMTIPQGLAVSSVANGEVGTASVSGNVITVTGLAALGDDGCIAKVTFTASVIGQKTVSLVATAQNNSNSIAVNGSTCKVSVSAAQTTVLPGDVDDSGEVTTNDLAQMKLFLVEKATINETAGDIDNDGKVNTSDLAILKIMLVNN